MIEQSKTSDGIQKNAEIVRIVILNSFRIVGIKQTAFLQLPVPPVSAGIGLLVVIFAGRHLLSPAGGNTIACRGSRCLDVFGNACLPGVWPPASSLAQCLSAPAGRCGPPREVKPSFPRFPVIELVSQI